MKDKKYHSVETVSKSNRKIGERSKIDTPNPQIHARSFSSLRTGTSIKSGGVEYNSNMISNINSKMRGK